MATLIRIKRRLGEEPLETIVVRAKRRRVDQVDGGRVDGGVDGGVLPPAVLARVATVESKDAVVDSSVLKEVQKGWEQKEKKLQHKEGRKEHKEREEEKPYQITSNSRGDIKTKEEEEEEKNKTTTTTTTAATTAATTTTATASTSHSTDSTDRKRKTGVDEDDSEIQNEKEEKKMKIYDTQISCLRNPQQQPQQEQEDVITCNGTPLKVEKFVYDLYYYPDNVDWTELVCERNLLVEEEDKEKDEEEEEDENAESYWGNEYPEEEEEEEDDDDDDDDDIDPYDYIHRPGRGRQLMKGGSDGSFDADEYEEEEEEGGFDEYGNLVVSSLISRLAITSLNSDDDDSD